MKEKNTFKDLYTSETVDQWGGEKTMEHAAGIWGRNPMLDYLKKNVIKKGDTVADIGSGGGYPSLKIADMVGNTGKVTGVELSKAQLGIEKDSIPLSKKYEEKENLSFINGNIEDIPIKTESVDNVVSFMVLHNLKVEDVKKTFNETSRIIKPDGKAVFLTMHPDFFNSDWNLDFIVCNKEDLEKYRSSKDKEGIKIRGIVKNAGGGEKAVAMYHHSVDNIQKAVKEAGLKIVEEKDLFIDEETAKDKFGDNSVKKYQRILLTG